MKGSRAWVTMPSTRLYARHAESQSAGRIMSVPICKNEREILSLRSSVPSSEPSPSRIAATMTMRLTGRDIAMLVIGVLFLSFAIAAGFVGRSVFGALAILPVMVIVTAVVGGYEVRQMGPRGGCGMAMVALGVLVALLVALQPGGDIVVIGVALIFAVVAIRRAAWLFQVRKRAAALVMALSAIFLAGWSAAYSGDRLSFYDDEIARGVREFTAYQLSYRQHSHRFQPLTPAQVLDRWKIDFAAVQHRNAAPVAVVSIDISYAPAGDHFVIRVKPRGPFPFVPYNFFTSWTVYRADDSGAVRAERVHFDRWCSERAPVIARVGDLRWFLANEQKNAENALGLLMQLDGESAFDVALRSGTAAARSAAISAAYTANSPRTNEVLLRALHDRDSAVRREASFYLGLRHDPQTIPALVAALNDPAEEVMFAASIALQATHNPQILGLVAPMLTNSSLPEKVRYQAAMVIGNVRGDAAADILIAALDDPSPFVRKGIVFGLGYTKSARARQRLLKVAASDRSPEVREAAASASE